MNDPIVILTSAILERITQNVDQCHLPATVAKLPQGRAEFFVVARGFQMLTKRTTGYDQRRDGGAAGAVL